MSRWTVRLLVGIGLLAMAGVGLAAVAPGAQAPPKPDGIRLFGMGFTDTGALWFLYLVHFENGQIGVLARLETEPSVFFGALLPDGACSLGADAFVPLIQEPPGPTSGRPAG